MEAKLREPLDAEFPKRLFALRRALPKELNTQMNVAAAVGISRSHLANLEGGRTPPSIEVLDRLAVHFKVTRAYLARGEITSIPELDFIGDNYGIETKMMFDIFTELSPRGQQMLTAIALYLRICEAGLKPSEPPPAP